MSFAPHIAASCLPGHLGFIGLELGLGLGFLLGLSAFALWAFVARRRARALESREVSQEALLKAELAATETPDHSPRARVDSGLQQVDPLRERRMPEQMVFSSFGDVPPRRCPKCDRKYPGVFEVCPFDMTRLRPVEGKGGGPAGPRHPLPRRYCSQCQRRFGPSAKFCYHDGTKLATDTAEAADRAPSLYVCRTCGLETREPTARCPHDDEVMEHLDPGERGFVAPTIPFHRCRQCGHLGPPTETTCPVDGALMLPEISARVTELPPTGYGPRRKVCKTCGSLFGAQSKHCAYDGDELLPLN